MAEVCHINLILQHRYYVQPYYHNSHIVTIKLYLLKPFYILAGYTNDVTCARCIQHAFTADNLLEVENLHAAFHKPPYTVIHTCIHKGYFKLAIGMFIYKYQTKSRDLSFALQ